MRQGRPRRRWNWYVGGVAALLLLLGACVGRFFFPGPGLGDLRASSSAEGGAPGPEQCHRSLVTSGHFGRGGSSGFRVCRDSVGTLLQSYAQLKKNQQGQLCNLSSSRFADVVRHARSSTGLCGVNAASGCGLWATTNAAARGAGHRSRQSHVTPMSQVRQLARKCRTAEAKWRVDVRRWLAGSADSWLLPPGSSAATGSCRGYFSALFGGGTASRHDRNALASEQLRRALYALRARDDVEAAAMAAEGDGVFSAADAGGATDHGDSRRNNGGVVAPTHLFVGDSMVRQLFQRLVAALRGAGVDEPHFDVALRDDLCFTAFDDGSDKLDIFAAPRTDTDILSQFGSGSLSVMRKLRVAAVKRTRHQRAGGREEAAGSPHSGGDVEAPHREAAEELAEALVRASPALDTGEWVNRASSIARCGEPINPTSTDGNGTAATPPQPRPLFHLAFVWSPESATFRSDFVDMLANKVRIATHTTGRMFWERWDVAAAAGLEDLVYGPLFAPIARPRSVSRAAVLTAHTKLAEWTRIARAASAEVATKASNSSGRSDAASTRGYDSAVLAAARRVKAALQPPRTTEAAEEDRRASAAAAAEPPLSMVLNLPLAFLGVSDLPKPKASAAGGPEAQNATAKRTEAQLRCAFDIVGMSAPRRRQRGGQNTRLGAPGKAEDAAVVAKNVELRLATANRTSTSRRPVTVLDVATLSANMHGGVHRADKHHFSCRLRPFTAKNTTRLVLASFPVPPSCPTAAAQPPVELVDVMGASDNARSQRRQPPPAEECPVTATAPRSEGTLCRDEGNLAIAAMWLMHTF